MSLTKEEKIKGSLLGLVEGDVVGVPVETYMPEDIQVVYGGLYQGLPQEYPLAIIKKHRPDRLKRLRPLGLYSDDGQQALALLNVCLSQGGFSIYKWANLLVDGQNQRAWRGIGKFFRSAVENLKNRKKPEQAGAHSAGIGAAMRIAPLGGLFYDNLHALKKISLESSLVTHADIRASVYAYAVAYTSARFIQGATPNEIKSELPKITLEVEKELITNYKNWNIDLSGGHDLSNCISELFEKPLYTLEEVKNRVIEVAKRRIPKKRDVYHPNDGFVLLGGLHALALALQENVNPKETLLYVCNLGDDTDTVGAIVGGLMGARCGTGWIESSRWIDKERVLKYADALVQRRMSPEPTNIFVANEAKLTKREINFQQNLK